MCPSRWEGKRGLCLPLLVLAKTQSWYDCLTAQPTAHRSPFNVLSKAFVSAGGGGAGAGSGFGADSPTPGSQEGRPMPGVTRALWVRERPEWPGVLQRLGSPPAAQCSPSHRLPCGTWAGASIQTQADRDAYRHAPWTEPEAQQRSAVPTGQESQRPADADEGKARPGHPDTDTWASLFRMALSALVVGFLQWKRLCASNRRRFSRTSPIPDRAVPEPRMGDALLASCRTAHTGSRGPWELRLPRGQRVSPDERLASCRH